MRLIIDTDIGMGTLGADPEDGLALLLAAHAADAELLLVTTAHGNVANRHVYSNARHLAGQLAQPFQVAPGASQPLLPWRTAPTQWQNSHAATDSIVPLLEPAGSPYTAFQALVAALELTNDPITLVAIAPLSNYATLALARPDLVSRVERLIVMGGFVTGPGNFTPVAEFNFWMDPDAAAIVIAADWPITMVGLDVCNRVRATEADLFPDGEPRTPLGKFVRTACAPAIAYRTKLGENGFPLYDTLAVAVALDPTLVSTVAARVEIETSTGTAAGASMVWRPGTEHDVFETIAPNAEVAIDVDIIRFRQLLQNQLLPLF